MTGGRIILPPTNPSLDSNGNPVSGSTLTYYQNGTTTPVSIYSDKALTVPLANPLTSDSAGVFPQVWASNAAGYSVKWTRTGFSDVTFNDIFPDLDSSAVGTYVSLNQSQVSLGTNVTTAFGTIGVGLIENAFTQTDSTTGAGTVATAYASTFGAVTFATPANAITITNAFGLYLKDPVAGSHVTLTNKYALGVDSLKVSGACTVNGAITGQDSGVWNASGISGITGFTLGVGGTGNSTLYANINGTSGATSSNFGLKLNANGATKAAFYYDVNTASVRISSGTLDPAIFIFANTGALRFAGYGAGTLTTDASGNVTASSDATLKDIKGPFSRSVSDIVKIDTSLWSWNQGSGMDTAATQASYTAQAVQAGVPESVSVGPDGKLTVFDGALIAALINCVKELDARVKALGG